MALILKKIEPDAPLILSCDTLHIYASNIMDIAQPDLKPSSIIEEYNQYGAHKDHPYSAPVPVAWAPWGPDKDYFEEVDKQVRTHIDKAICQIADLIQKHKYKTISYSLDPEAERLVNRYIVKELEKLCS